MNCIFKHQHAVPKSRADQTLSTELLKRLPLRFKTCIQFQTRLVSGKILDAHYGIEESEFPSMNIIHSKDNLDIESKKVVKGRRSIVNLTHVIAKARELAEHNSSCIAGYL